jgi:hypothetical protein
VKINPNLMVRCMRSWPHSGHHAWLSKHTLCACVMCLCVSAQVWPWYLQTETAESTGSLTIIFQWHSTCLGERNCTKLKYFYI